MERLLFGSDGYISVFLSAHRVKVCLLLFTLLHSEKDTPKAIWQMVSKISYMLATSLSAVNGTKTATERMGMLATTHRWVSNNRLRHRRQLVGTTVVRFNYSYRLPVLEQHFQRLISLLYYGNSSHIKNMYSSALSNFNVLLEEKTFRTKPELKGKEGSLSLPTPPKTGGLVRHSTASGVTLVVE